MLCWPRAKRHELAATLLVNRFLLPVILVAVLAAAGCGGGGGASSSLESGDIAVVGDMHVSKQHFDELMSEAKANYKLQGRTFPKAGTSEYSSIKSQAVTILVQQAETEAEAGKLGITVSDNDVQKQLDTIKQRCCQGKEAKYQAALKQQGLTDAEVRENARSNVYGQKLANKITAGLTVAPTAIEAYYIQHQSDFKKPSSRDVRYILLGKNKASLAGSLKKQLDGAADSTWCTLAKKYSQDRVRQGPLLAADQEGRHGRQQAVRLVRAAADGEGHGGADDAGEQGREADQGDDPADEEAGGDHRLDDEDPEVLLQGRQDRVSGRLRAEPRSLRRDRHDHDLR